MSQETPKVSRVARFGSPQHQDRLQTPRPSRPPATSGVRTPVSESDDASFSPRSVASDGSDLSPSLKSSNWKASIELSLTTRKRLIRKPLPQLPGQSERADGSDTVTAGTSSHGQMLGDDLKAADDWWPCSLPKAVSDSAPTNGSIRFPKGPESRAEVSKADLGLDEQSSDHLLTILHYAALREAPSAETDANSSASPAQYAVDEKVLNSLYVALCEAFEYLSTKEVLSALQRTASIRWRAEAQLRNAATASNANSVHGTSQSSSSKWARFAWPAAALGRAYREAQRATLPPLPTDFPAFPSSADDEFQLFGSESRVRKRDVAIKILSNAVWFVRNYGPAAGVETLYGRQSLIADTRIGSDRKDGEDNDSDRSDDDGDDDRDHNDHVADDPTASIPRSSMGQMPRRTSESLMRINGGRPNFLSKSTPTTALSGTATPEPPSPAGGSSLTSSAAEPPSANMSKADRLDPDGRDKNGTPTVVDQAEDTIPVPAPAIAAAAPSKAMEHLASLNAASGAALRAKAQAMHKGDGGIDDLSEGTSQRLVHQSSQPSLRSTASHQTEAEAAETAALAKAEREYLAMIGRGCDEWAKMVLCQICASFEVEDQGKDTLKAKSAKQSQALVQGLKDGSAANLSSISTRSDMTARAVPRASTDQEGSVIWLPEVFEGDDIFSNDDARRSLAGRSKQQEHEDRVKVVGGTFSIRVRDEAERKAMAEILELMVYVGCSMILEAGFLQDSDAARPKIVRVPSRSTSSVPQHQVVIPRRRQSTLPSGHSADLVGEGALNASVEPNAAHAPSSPSSDHRSPPRRWTRSLWGMLQSKAPSIPLAGHSSRHEDGHVGDSPMPSTTADAHGLHDAPSVRGESRRPSLQLSRTRSGGNSVAEGRKLSRVDGGSTVATALPRSQTVSQHEPRSSISSITSSIGAALGSAQARDSSDHRTSSSGRTNGKLGRLMGVFGRAIPDAAHINDVGGGQSLVEERERRASVPEHPSTVTLGRDATIKTHNPAQVTQVSRFPPLRPGPSPLTSSPELAMLRFYQQQHAKANTAAFYAAFLQLQSIGFLCDEGSDGVTFGTPSNGISSTGELHLQVGTKSLSKSTGPSVRTLQGPFGAVGNAIGLGPQLLGADVRRANGGGQLNGLRREEVHFYQRLSNSRDVPLGQLIEELCVRAGSLEAEDRANSTEQDDAKARRRSPTNKARSEQQIHFLHGHFKVKISTTMLPSIGDGTKGAEKAAKESDPSIGDNQERVPISTSQSSSTEDADVSAVAAALRTDKESAKTAVAVAETAVQAAERGTQVLVDGKPSVESSIWMWNASAKSGWQGHARPMSESTYLMSFARYLEAILYHPALQRVAGMEPATGNASDLAGPAMQKRLRHGREEDERGIAESAQLLRMFRSGRAMVKVHAQPIRIYELNIDEPVMHGRPRPNVEVAADLQRRNRVQEARLKAQAAALKAVIEETRLDVQHFFASVKQQMTVLEDVFVARELDESGRTLRRKPADLEASIVADRGRENKADTSTGGKSLGQSVDSTATVSESQSDPLTLLTRLRSSLRSDEFELYDALKLVHVPENVNGLRKAFADRAKSAKNRLCAWTKKHLTKAEQTKLGRSTYQEPEYFSAGRHAFPGSQYLIRENEPLSIVAFSLSSRDFKTELGTWQEPPHADDDDDDDDYFGPGRGNSVLEWRKGIVEGAGSQISSASSFVSNSTSPLREKTMRSVPISQLDPDTDEVFYEPEPVQTTLKRKRRPRETSILSLRVRRVGSTVSSTVSDRRASRTSMILADDDSCSANAATAESNTKVTTVSSEAEAEGIAESIRSANGGEPVAPAPNLQPAPRSSSLLHTRLQSTQKSQTSTISSAATDSTFRAHITQVSGRPTSLANIFSKDTNDHVAADAPSPSMSEVHDASRNTSSGASAHEYWTLGHSHGQGQQGLRLPPKSQTLKSTRSISESVVSTTPSSRTMDAVSLAPSSALPTPSVIAESPHIKHNLIHSNTKISCVSWFAEEFAALREKWGVEHDFAHSLSRCQPWNTTGGKSKSAFFKTQDERFIGKQLLTVWSVDEKEAFLEFAPAYLRYMMNAVTNDCPTLLVKIAGVYSIKIKDVKTGETRLKMNVMVQENLWAGDGGKSVRFDLKGIKDRKVKLNPQQQQQQQQQQQAASTASASAAAGSATNSSAAATASTSASTSIPGTPQGAAPSHPTPPATTAPATVASAGPEGASPAVWWDSEWIERYRSKAFVPESQKELFSKALTNDTQFLTASNIMDYSLLLGVIEQPQENEANTELESDDPDDDLETSSASHSTSARTDAERYGPATAARDPRRATDPNPTFRCRIVDFLGAFTLAKQLESSSKKALKSGLEAKGNVTVLPPLEYATRFVTAMQGYFVGVPFLPGLDPEWVGRKGPVRGRLDAVL